jgi:hypothetical protein
MALESSQPLPEMKVRVLPVRKADNPAAICDPTVYKMWGYRYLTTLWASATCYRVGFTFYTAFCLVMPYCLMDTFTQIYMKYKQIPTGHLQLPPPPVRGSICPVNFGVSLRE